MPDDRISLAPILEAIDGVLRQVRATRPKTDQEAEGKRNMLARLTEIRAELRGWGRNPVAGFYNPYMPGR